MGTRGTASQPPDVVTNPDRASLVAAFTDRASSLGVTVIRATGSDAAGAAVVAEFDARAPLVSTELVQAAPNFCAALAARGWTLTTVGSPSEANDAPIGLSLAQLAVAETGSILLAEDTLADRGIGMLVAAQLVVCPTAALVPSLDEAAPVLRALATRPGGAYATLVTGPSRTADIERVLTVGVQGPAKLAVLFVDDMG